MDSPDDPPPATPSLEDQIVKYDLRQLLKEAEQEFDASLASGELVDQETIGQFFKLQPDSNARN